MSILKQVIESSYFPSNPFQFLICRNNFNFSRFIQIKIPLIKLLISLTFESYFSIIKQVTSLYLNLQLGINIRSFIQNRQTEFMDDTEKYLNQILKKRLGSVVNYGGSSKAANNVTRISKQQEKVENMPTVFRKKRQTVYIQAQNQHSHYSQAQSEYLSMKQGTKDSPNNPNDRNEMPEEPQTSNQRVEYMLISKRIQSLKQDELISPTVDVTNYRKTTIQERIDINRNQNQFEFKSNLNGASSRQVSHSQSEKGVNQQPKRQQISQLNDKDSVSGALESKISNNTDQSKRKRIFGLQ